MNYELAKELKDTGFPQMPNLYGFVYIDQTHIGHIQSINNGDMKSEYVYIPTLEELIEACGESISHIKKFNNAWWAVSDMCEHSKECDCINNIEEMGQTLSEAVAKLWLALSKK